MALVTDRVIDYPIVVDDGLDVDPVYRELQQKQGEANGSVAE